MPAHTLHTVVTLLSDSGLLRSAELQQLDELRRRYRDPYELVRVVLDQGWLTLYQAVELFQGRGQDLLLDEYVVLDRLGQGGTSHVYKARHRATDREAALKVLRRDQLAAPGALSCLQREGWAGARLLHPNVVRTYGVLRAREAHVLVMEYVEGKDLARLVREHGPLPVGRACDYARQAALGLQHAFDRGLVHRDVKPSNLLLTGDSGVIKVLDLGLARLHEKPEAGPAGEGADAARSAVGVGTPDYVAPEQVLEPGQVDVRADVYGLGCTLYHLLTGRPPFPGGTVEEKVRRHRDEEPADLAQVRPEVPRELAAVVRRMLAKPPAERQPTPGSVADALAPFAEPGDCTGRFVLTLGAEELTSLDPQEPTAVLSEPDTGPGTAAEGN